jgi:hypothetical protein
VSDFIHAQPALIPGKRTQYSLYKKLNRASIQWWQNVVLSIRAVERGRKETWRSRSLVRALLIITKEIKKSTYIYQENMGKERKPWRSLGPAFSAEFGQSHFQMRGIWKMKSGVNTWEVSTNFKYVRNIFVSDCLCPLEMPFLFLYKELNYSGKGREGGKFVGHINVAQYRLLPICMWQQYSPKKFVCSKVIKMLFFKG